MSHTKAHRCPKCFDREFSVTAHVAQNWAVDEHGYYLEVIADATDTIHRPNDEDWWSCLNCGHEASGEIFTQTVIPDYHFSIYQLNPNGPNYRDLAFSNLKNLERRGLKVCKDNYIHIFSGERSRNDSAMDALEKLYTRFNTDIPNGFVGHSLSVSDIVVFQSELLGKTPLTAYFCDSFGWVELPSWEKS